MKNKIVILFLILLGFGINSVNGQENSEQDQNKEAPQILTSDLVRKQIVNKPSLSVSFIILDDDNVETVLINNVPQNFEVDDTISISKKFVFQPGKTLISVVAIDEKGNRREKSFLVGYGEEGKVALSDSEKEKTAPFKILIQAKAALETDSNPTNDISSPVKIGNLDLKGVISDSEQADNKKSLSLVAAFSKGSVSGYVGATKSVFDKSANSSLSTQTMFVGGNYLISSSKSFAIPFSVMIADINVGGGDFSQNMSFGPGILFKSWDSDGFYSHSFGMDITSISYADSSKTSGSQNMLFWDYNSLDKEKQDNFRFFMTSGVAAAGTKESESSYISYDLDWTNQWESGFKWDLGFGIAQLDYKNDIPLTTEMGKTRLDIPIRFSNGFGWGFSAGWKLMYNYKYLFNLSNKSPYVRIVSGLTINGVF